MKNTIIKAIVLVLMCWTAVEANAQWAVGAKFGPTWTTADRSYTGRIDETYSPLVGMDAGFLTRYNFNDWLAASCCVHIVWTATSIIWIRSIQSIVIFMPCFP